MVTFGKILVATDFLASEKPALLTATRFAALHGGETGEGGEVLLQHVVNDDIERFAHAAVAHDAGEIQKHMVQAAEAEMKSLLTQMAGSGRVRAVLSRGRVAEQICALAEKEQADLIVMGGSEGGVTGQVIRMTARPVLTFPSLSASDGPAQGFKVSGLLVATDLSRHSTDLIGYAFELKRILDVPIHLLYVIETSRAIEFAVTHGELAHTIKKMKAWALTELRNLLPAEVLADPSVILHVERGSVRQSIEAAAASIEGCLTILGSHRHGSAHTHLLGSTTGRLLASTESPVLIWKLA